MTKTCQKCSRTATLRLENNSRWHWTMCTQHAQQFIRQGAARVDYVSPAPGFTTYKYANGGPALPAAARELVLRWQR
ncbi:MAG: hypothetical protein ACXVXO_00670 [Mycobacteriaceae bacterium]